MAQRNEVAGAFGCHDGGDAGDAYDVAFFCITLADDLEGLAAHADFAAGGGASLGIGFGSNIDHVRLSALIEMSQALVVFICAWVWFLACHKMNLNIEHKANLWGKIVLF